MEVRVGFKVSDRKSIAYFCFPFSADECNCKHETNNDATDETNIVQCCPSDFNVVHLKTSTKKGKQQMSSESVTYNENLFHRLCEPH